MSGVERGDAIPLAADCRQEHVNESTSKRPIVVLAGWVLLPVSLAAAFGHNFYEMWRRWFPAWHRGNLGLYDRIIGGESYYTHGPLVPLVSLIIAILLIRKTRIARRPCRGWGWAVLICGLLLHLVASLARVNFASGATFIIVLAGLVLLLWGAQAARRLWFPLLLLVFMIPAPEVSIANWNFHLKVYAAKFGVWLSQAVGILVERSGNTVYLFDAETETVKTLVIANVCNGLRTIISLLAFGALYAYVCKLRGWLRWLLFAMTVPVAVAANALRILSLILVCDIWNEEAATGWFHEFSGLMIYAIAFAGMFTIERLILWAMKVLRRDYEVLPLFNGVLRAEDDTEQWPRLVGALAAPRTWVAIGLVGLTAAGAWWLNRAGPGGHRMNSDLIPRTLMVDGQALEGETWCWTTRRWRFWRRLIICTACTSRRIGRKPQPWGCA